MVSIVDAAYITPLKHTEGWYSGRDRDSRLSEGDG